MKYTIIFSLLFIVMILGFYPIPDFIYPFIISFILAYLLNPMTEMLNSRYKLSRMTISLSFATITFLMIIGVILYLSPLLYNQLHELALNTPKYKYNIQHNLLPFINSKLEIFDPNISTKIVSLIDKSIEAGISTIGYTTHSIVSYTLAIVHVLIWIILVPVILFFILKDWNYISAKFFDLVPQKYYKFVKSIFVEIDNILSSYLKGIIMVCLILSIIYSLIFSLIGTNLSILLGIVCGFLIILPFIGAIIAIITVALFGYLSFGLHIQAIYLIVSYVIISTIESTLFTPNVIGDRLGISPAWIIFAVMLFGEISGLVGILIATPLTGVTLVLLRNLQSEYKKSEFYNKA